MQDWDVRIDAHERNVSVLLCKISARLEHCLTGKINEPELTAVQLTNHSATAD